MNRKERKKEFERTQKWLDNFSKENIKDISDENKELTETIFRIHNSERCNKKVAIKLGLKCNSKLVITGITFDNENSERIIETECIKHGHHDFF